MLIVAIVAHCPAVGVNVYSGVPVLDVLTTDGDHVPVYPFRDVVGKVPGVAFRQ